MMILETQRLILREVLIADAQFIFELLNEPSFIKNIGDRNIKTLEDARQYIVNRMIASYKRYGYGLYIVQIKDTREIAGICGLVKRDVLPVPDVGFAFLPRFWRKGYAYESARGVLDYAKKELGQKRILGITSLTNVASIGVLEKLGLRFEKTMKLPENTDESKLFAIDL
jgi:RimJ/RimL family protein N-acetyltransferase